MNFFIPVFLIVLTFGSSPLLADSSESTISSRLTRLIERVDQLEKKQQQIIVSENKIVDEIQNLKIQSRR